MSWFWGASLSLHRRVEVSTGVEQRPHFGGRHNAHSSIRIHDGEPKCHALISPAPIRCRPGGLTSSRFVISGVLSRFCHALRGSVSGSRFMALGSRGARARRGRDSSGLGVQALAASQSESNVAAVDRLSGHP
jgi:hypothetical protein